MAALVRGGGLLNVLTEAQAGPLGPVKYRQVSWEFPEFVAPPNRITEAERAEVDAGQYVIE